MHYARLNRLLQYLHLWAKRKSYIAVLLSSSQVPCAYIVAWHGKQRQKCGQRWNQTLAPHGPHHFWWAWNQRTALFLLIDALRPLNRCWIHWFFRFLEPQRWKWWACVSSWRIDVKLFCLTGRAGYWQVNWTIESRKCSWRTPLTQVFPRRSTKSQHPFQRTT